jgi:hypothetical protein
MEAPLVASLVPVRLTSEYRGNRPGVVLHATPGLARFLTSNGKAVEVSAESPDRCVERAVARPGGGT